jgi:hypothetical protein
MGVVEQSLIAEDQLLILMQAALYLTATRGLGSPEARICYERAEPLCHSLNRPVLLHCALMGQWRYIHMTDKQSAAMQIAERMHSLAQEQNDSTLILKTEMALDSARVRSGSVSFSIRVESFSGIDSSR